MARTRRRRSYRKSKRWNPSISYEPTFFQASSNPGADRPRPAYGQWLMSLGFPANDPIVELGSAWAAGVSVGSRLINQAILSAERWRESRDKRHRSAATAIINKLTGLHRRIAAVEERGQFRYAPGSLTSHNPGYYGGRRHTRRSRRRNPRGRSTRASRARSWHRRVRESLPWWSRGNPFQEDWHVQQEIRRARMAKRRGRSSRRRLRSLGRRGRGRVIRSVLGAMNPRRRRR